MLGECLHDRCFIPEEEREGGERWRELEQVEQDRVDWDFELGIGACRREADRYPMYRLVGFSHGNPRTRREAERVLVEAGLSSNDRTSRFRL